MADSIEQPAEREGTNRAGDLEIAFLQGPTCHTVGHVRAISLGECAITLCRGGAPKRYEHVDPNEDAAAFAIGSGGLLLAVADAHNGNESAVIAIDSVLSRASSLIGDDSPRDAWPRTAHSTIAEAQAAILAAVTHGARDMSRTTLSLAVIRPAEDWFGFAAIGDSHIFRVGTAESFDVGSCADRHRHFLGDPARSRDDIVEGTVLGSETLNDVRAVVLATDGLSERGIGVDVPEYTVSECAEKVARFEPHLRPLELARGVTDAALAAQRRQKAGDNIATAAWHAVT